MREKGHLIKNRARTYELAKFFVSFLPSNEEIIDAIDVGYKQKNDILLLTNNRLLCFSFTSHHRMESPTVSLHSEFWLHELKKLVAAENRLTVYHEASEFIVYFVNKKLTNKFVTGRPTNFIEVEKGSSNRINIRSWVTSYAIALLASWVLVNYIFPLFSKQSTEIQTVETQTVPLTEPASSASDERIICLADGCFTEKELRRKMYDSVCPKIVEDPSNQNYSECKKEGYKNISI